LTFGESEIVEEPTAFSACQVVEPLFTHPLTVPQYHVVFGETVVVSKSR
jgi:hypothetical protein